MISNMKLIDKKLTLVTWGRLHKKKLTLVTWGRLHKLYCFSI